MINSEKYKTTKKRVNAFFNWLNRKGISLGSHGMLEVFKKFLLGYSIWLDLEAEGEED